MGDFSDVRAAWDEGGTDTEWGANQSKKKTFFDRWLLKTANLPEKHVRYVKIDAEQLQKWSLSSNNRSVALQHAELKGLPPLPDGSVGDLRIDYDSLSGFKGLDSLLDGDIYATQIKVLCPPRTVIGKVAGREIALMWKTYGADWPVHESGLPVSQLYEFSHCPGITEISLPHIRNFAASARPMEWRAKNICHIDFVDCPVAYLGVEPRDLLDDKCQIFLKLKGSLIRKQHMTEMCRRVIEAGNSLPAGTRPQVALILGPDNFYTRARAGGISAESGMYIWELGWDSRLAHEASVFAKHGIEVKLPHPGHPELVYGNREECLVW